MLLHIEIEVPINVQTRSKKRAKAHKTFTISAIAVSNKRALTSLHGKFDLNTRVKVITKNGVVLWGYIEFELFVESKVDIAVVVLEEAYEFVHFLQLATSPVKLIQRIFVVGLKNESNGIDVNIYARSITVDMIEEYEDGALFHTSYYNFEDCFGTGVIVTVENNVPKVVGVHVTTHEDSRYYHSKKVSANIVGVFDAVIKSEIHGRHAYCLICEIARVPSLIALLEHT